MLQQPAPDFQPTRSPLKCQWEPLTSIAPEIRILTQRQQDEVGEGYEPYDPDWDRYFMFERGGSLRIWTARSLSGGLAGYVVWLLLRGLHNKSTRFATADLAYLTPEWREGALGYRFIKSALDAVERDFKPDIRRFETNMLYRDGRLGAVLLKRLGFRKLGEVWQK